MKIIVRRVMSTQIDCVLNAITANETTRGTIKMYFVLWLRRCDMFSTHCDILDPSCLFMYHMWTMMVGLQMDSCSIAVTIFHSVRLWCVSKLWNSLLRPSKNFFTLAFFCIYLSALTIHALFLQNYWVCFKYNVFYKLDFIR